MNFKYYLLSKMLFAVLIFSCFTANGQGNDYYFQEDVLWNTTTPFEFADLAAIGFPLGNPTVTQPPLNGALNLNGQAYTVEYTPNTNYIGPDTFVVSYCFGPNPTDCFNGVFYVNVVNYIAPVAVDDEAYANSGQTTIIDVLTNDKGSQLSVTSASAPSGTVSINADQTLSFTPSPNSPFGVVIDYTICDSTNTCDNGQVQVSVYGGTSNPNAGTFDILAESGIKTSLGVEQLGSMGIVGFSPTIIRQPDNGTTSISGDTIFYQSNSGYTGFDTVGLNFHGGTFIEWYAIIEVVPLGALIDLYDDVVFNSDSTAITITPLDNDLGTDLQVSTYTNPSNGSLSFDANTNSFVYTPSIYRDDMFTYTACNLSGTCETATVEIVYGGFSGIAGAITFSTAKNTPFTFFFDEVDVNGPFGFILTENAANGNVDTVSGPVTKRQYCV